MYNSNRPSAVQMALHLKEINSHFVKSNRKVNKILTPMDSLSVQIGVLKMGVHTI